MKGIFATSLNLLGALAIMLGAPSNTRDPIDWGFKTVLVSWLSCMMLLGELLCATCKFLVHPVKFQKYPWLLTSSSMFSFFTQHLFLFVFILVRAGGSLLCPFGRDALVTTVRWQVVVVGVGVNGGCTIFFFCNFDQVYTD